LGLNAGSAGAESLTVTTKDGRVLDLLVSGPGDGQLLVLHMGTPCGLVPLPSGLDPGRLGIRTVLYARPGYGRSTPQPGRTVADGAGDTAAILDRLGVGRFLNVGFSGGGPYALACDALLGDRCLGTAVIAGPGSRTDAEPESEVRAWYEHDEDNQLALAGDIAGFRKGCDRFVAQLGKAQGEQIAANAKSPADRRFFSEGYGEWVASFFRAAGVQGSHGATDDYLAMMGDWGFALADTGHVTIWQGNEDQNVPPYHGVWLRDHLPAADLRRLEHDGHVSILRHLPEIIDSLTSEPT
jgi:pimeloyl-ACP methyl ester carboxylesterase